jgi:HPt (histidine-containing phosphotransfer) domain-containing protein
MMAALQASYRQKLLDRLIGIENASIQLDENANDEAAIGLIRRECHKLSGVSTSLGFPEIGELATDIDCAITLENTPWPELRDRVEKLLDKMEEELD